MPASIAAALAPVALATFVARGRGLALAAAAALAPLPPAVRAAFRAHLSHEEGDVGLAILAAADEPAAATRHLSCLPPDLPCTWPVERAHASSPDEWGVQLVYVVRRTPAGAAGGGGSPRGAAWWSTLSIA